MSVCHLPQQMQALGQRPHLTCTSIPTLGSELGVWWQMVTEHTPVGCRMSDCHFLEEGLEVAGWGAFHGWRWGSGRGEPWGFWKNRSSGVMVGHLKVGDHLAWAWADKVSEHSCSPHHEWVQSLMFTGKK